jgi:hypothetical protein
MEKPILVWNAMLRFSRIRIISFYFVHQLLFIKSKNWNEEILSYAQNWLILSRSEWNKITLFRGVNVDNYKNCLITFIAWYV